jgi:ABC-type microcin C transport system permease subunit YejB
MSRSAATISANPANAHLPEFRPLAQFPNLPQRPGSIQVLVRFILRTAVLVVFAGFGAVGFDRSFTVLLWMSVIFSAVIGVMKREQPLDNVLNHWDETVAYAALFSLVSIFNHSAAA